MDAMPTYDANAVHAAGYGSVQFGGDDRLIVWFFEKPLVHAMKSKEAGRPIHENVVHVHIQQPGERDYSEIPANEEHRARFPRQWAAFQTKAGNKIEGTLLSVLFPADHAVVENLRVVNIQTVEQLATCNDTQIQNIGLGGREFVTKAQQFMKHAETGKGLNEVWDRLRMIEREVAAKDKRIADLEAALAEFETDEPRRGPGRPRKEAA